MKTSYYLVMIGLLLTSCASKDKGREQIDFTQDWKFHLGDDSLACKTEYNDSDWRQLNLPHDWSIEADFSDQYPATAGGGALPGGIGWYRKEFVVNKSDEGKTIYIDFDGIYWNSTVWINGQLLGHRPNGYISFRYDMTPYIKLGKKNVIAVKVDNSQQPNSRWYSGSGIYRNVRLVTVNQLHIDHWGTYVTTPIVTDDNAEIKVETKVKNTKATNEQAELYSILVDAQGKEITQATTSIQINANGSTEEVHTLKINKPTLWSVENPYLYKVITQVKQGGTIVDQYETPIGVRYFAFDAEKGFLLNGNQVKIKGVCNHHDLGCLGTAVNTRAIERQLEILKDMGCNGIRTSHNPPAPELLDLCDKMGFIVMNEVFDMWRKKKSPHDYAQYFAEWHEKDLTDFVLRDRNHPSIFIWSIGNEILEQWTDINTDTLDLQQANMMFNFANTMTKEVENKDLHVNSLLTIKLADMVKKLDPSRPISSGNNETEPHNHLFRSKTMDIIGFNYHEYNWGDQFKKKYPGEKLIITESTSSLMSRGYYEMPSDKINIRPESWDKPFLKEGNQCSSYDNSHAPWGSTHEASWKVVKKEDHIAGLYIWTGFDYLGEPTPFWWPSRSSYFGIIDLAGFPKDIYYMYQSEWTNKDVLHVFPHWNWTEGQDVDIWTYYNNADEVELFVNDKSMGRKSKQGDELHLMWRVPFAKGTLKAVSYLKGKEVLSKEIRTAGNPVSIRLTADRQVIKSDGKDLSFITAEVLDAQGNVVPTATNMINFSTEGAGAIVGTDNGDATDHDSLKKPSRKLFSGKALVVVQSTTSKGTMKVTAKSDGFKEATLDVRIE